MNRLALSLTAASLLTLAGAARAEDSLAAYGQLTAGQSINSPAGRYTLTMQTDCNLVLYEGRQSRWSSRTNNRGVGCHLVLQGDGNLVIYGADQAPRWNSNTVGRGGDRLRLQDDGNLVLYAGRQAVWATNTAQAPTQLDRRTDPARDPDGRPRGGDRSGTSARDTLRAGTSFGTADEEAVFSANGEVRLRLGRDCNLVLETRDRSIWESRTTSRSRNCRATFGNDGVLSVTADGWRLWSSGVSAGGSPRLVVQNDGNLVAYSGGRAYWATNTAGRAGRR